MTAESPKSGCAKAPHFELPPEDVAQSVVVRHDAAPRRQRPELTPNALRHESTALSCATNAALSSPSSTCRWIERHGASTAAADALTSLTCATTLPTRNTVGADGCMVGAMTRESKNRSSSQNGYGPETPVMYGFKWSCLVNILTACAGCVVASWEGADGSAIEDYGIQADCPRLHAQFPSKHT